MPEYTIQDNPNSVQIEFVQGCPLMCEFCGLQGMERKMHFMSKETLQRIVGEIARLGWTSRIEIAMHGEPTMHPEFTEMVGIVRKALPKNYIMMLTNGFGLRENAAFKTAALFGAGLNCLGIEEYESAPSKEWVNAIRGSYAQANVETSYPGIIKNYPQCGPEGNPHHREKKARIVFIAAIDTETSGTHACLGNHCGAAAPLNDKQAGKRCTRPFRELAIRWDGNVAVCCNDFRGEFLVGNVNSLTLDAIWQHPRFWAARVHLYHGMRTFKPCQGCDHRSFRSGLLPDREGKATLGEPTQEHVALLAEAIEAGPLAVVVLRDWEA